MCQKTPFFGVARISSQRLRRLGRCESEYNAAATGSGKEHLRLRLVQIMNRDNNRSRSLLSGLLCDARLCGCDSARFVGCTVDALLPEIQ